MILKIVYVYLLLHQCIFLRYLLQLLPFGCRNNSQLLLLLPFGCRCSDWFWWRFPDPLRVFLNQFVSCVSLITVCCSSRSFSGRVGYGCATWSDEKNQALRMATARLGGLPVWDATVRLGWVARMLLVFSAEVLIGTTPLGHPPNSSCWQFSQRFQVSSGFRLNAQDTAAFVQQFLVRQGVCSSVVVRISRLKVGVGFFFGDADCFRAAASWDGATDSSLIH